MTLSHATFAINTVNHMFGTRRFKTADDSTNNALTAFFAVGEGWHNNHHRYQRAARNGFYWWEYDPTYYMIRLMEKVGLAWDVQGVPERIYREARESATQGQVSPVDSVDPIEPADSVTQIPASAQ
jgi:stearoyl-CoA desaturase (delta-9 desaturase)